MPQLGDPLGDHRRRRVLEVREPAVHRLVQGARRPQLPRSTSPPTARARGVVAASAGNHAQGVAYHARLLGIPATIVMPADTPFTKVVEHRASRRARRARGCGLRGRARGGEADRSRQRRDTRARLRRSADHRRAGHDRPRDARPDVNDLDAIVVPVGGGGLIAGIAVAVKALRPEMRVIGVQAEGYAGMLHALGQAPRADRRRHDRRRHRGHANRVC